MFSSGSNAGLDTSAPLVMQWHRQQRAVPLQPTRQSDADSNHSHPALLSAGLVADLCNTPQSTTLGLHPVIHVPNYMDHYSFTDP